MKVSEHIVYGSTASVALTPFFGMNSLFFLVGSLIIDLDHYIDFLYYGRFKNWSLKKMFRFHGYFSKSKPSDEILALEAFHTIEFFVGFFLVAWKTHSSQLYLLFFGMAFHLFLDLLRLKNLKKIHHRALSFIEYRIRSRAMIQKGHPPEQIFAKAYGTIFS